MADRRPRNQRPRTRGGKSRLADLAAVERQQQSVRELQEALQPEAEALSSSDRHEVVDHIRARAVELAQQRAQGDVAPVVEATLDEIFGLGPLEPLLRDPANRTIRLDGIHLSADGEAVDWGFRDDAHARSVIDRILASVGEDLATTSGDVRVTMMDGSTVLARLVGPSLQVRITRP
jgi:pilus assembly protein CpaF